MLKKDKIWIIFILFVVIFQYSDIIFHRKIFFVRDLTFLFHPWKTAVYESLLNGRMPLWNPYSYCGMPLMANFQTAVFYPFSIFFYIFGFVNGLKLFTVFHTFIAALFLFLYLRYKNIKTIPSFTAGIIFAFGGYLITKTEFLSLFGTAVWLPLILLLGTAASSRVNVFTAAMAVSFALFAGYPPVLLFIMVLLAVELLLKNHPPPVLWWGNNIKKLGLIILFAILISSVQILSSLELILNSIRKSGLLMEDAVIWTANYSDMVSLLSPLFLKIEVTGLFTGEKYFWLKSFWIGFAASFMALFGILSSFKIKKFLSLEMKKNILYFLLLVFSLLFALGNKTPVYHFAYTYIPGVNLIRYPPHILFIPFFIFIIFTASGLNNLKKISLLVSFLIVFELLYYSHKIHPIIGHNYYFEKGLVADFLQKDKDLFRFFSTPRTTWSRKIKVPAYGDIGWHVLRDRLTGLGSMPFHLYDAGGIGEPLEIKEHADLIFEVQKKNGADNANQLLSLMNVKYLLSDYYFNSKKWKLSHKSHLFVYKNKNFIERSFVLDKTNQRKKAKIVHYTPEKVKIETANSGTLILSDVFYPGWQTFVNGQKTDINPVNFIFRSIKLENSRNYKIVFLYSPVLFKLGLLISLFSICIMIMYIHKIYNYEFHASPLPAFEESKGGLITRKNIKN